jgi:cytochrome c2
MAGPFVLLTGYGGVDVVNPKSFIDNASETEDAAEHEPVAIPRAAGAETVPSQKLFSDYWASCHSLSFGETDVGPPLGGILAPEIGTAPAYAYSPSLQGVSGVWDDELLVAFVNGGGAALAGTIAPHIEFSPAEVWGIRSRVMEQSSRLAAASAGAARRGADDLGPFTVPFAVDAPRTARAYEELVAGFGIGFDKSRDSLIEVRQKRITHPAAVPSYHHYALEIRLVDLRDSDWATAERVVPGLERGVGVRVGVTLVAKLPEATQVRVELFVPQKGDSDRRLLVGEPDIGTALSAHYFGAAIDAAELGNIDPAVAPRVVLLLPLKNGLIVEIAALTIHAEAWQAINNIR